MAIKFSQFNLRTDHTSGMYLVGYDGNQNIHITVDNLFDDFINGTENTIAMFGTGGTVLADSMLSQNANATLLTVAGQLNVDSAATFDTSITVSHDSILNGNVTLGNASTDLITQTGTLYLNGPVKDTTDTLGAVDQVLLSDATGELTFTDLADLHVGGAEVVEVPVKNVQGSALVKGDPVYISGSVGASGKLEVQLADASNTLKMPAVGLLKQDLANNAEGFAVVTGKLRNLITDPIDGVNPTENDVIYVKPSGTSGAALTTTKPVYGNFIQNIGKVGRVSTAADGNFVVSSILRTNDIPNLTPGRLWVGSTGNTIESQTLFVDEANARLGIGTASPAGKLEVNGGTGVATSGGTLIVRQDGDTSNDGIALTSSNAISHRMFKNAGGTFLMGPSTNSDAFALDLNGNVGIGTTSPTHPLSVFANPSNGQIAKYKRTSTGGAWLELENNSGGFGLGTSGSEFYIYDRNNSAYSLAINSSGNVGIGTTSPGQKLTVDGDVGITTGNQLFVNDIAAYTGAMTIGPSGTSELKFRTSGNERMRIDSSGYVGINTSSPGANLDVNGQIRLSSAGQELQFANHNVGAYRDTNNRLVLAGYGGIDFNAESTASGMDAQTRRMRIKPSGQIQFDEYGAGTFTGTATKNLAVDSTGNVIETDGSIIDGSGTTNYVAKWSDPNTLTDSVIYDDGTNVGIGTTSPTSLLSLGNGVSAQKLLLYDNNDNAKYGFGIQANELRQFVPSANNASITFGSISSSDGTTFTERMRIVSSGNVGIGTASPSEKLSVSPGDNVSAEIGKSLVGNIGLSGYAGFKHRSLSSSISYALLQSSTGKTFLNASSTESIRFRINNADKMTLTNAGNFGIGTTSPARPLHVNGAGINFVAEFQSTDDKASILIQDDDTLNYIHSQDGYLSLGGQNALSTNNLNINSSSGNVGIGTTSPSTKLEVAGTVGNFQTTGHQIFLTRNGNNEIYAVGASSVLALGTNSAEKMRIDSSGNVGIGETSPASKLHISDAAVIFTTTSTNGVSGFIHNVIGGGTALYRIQDNGTERMRIDSSGNVGIGTTSPSATLHVAGSGKFENNVNIAGTGNLNIQNTTGSGSGITFIDTSWQAGIEHTSGKLLFRTGGQTDRMIIGSNGNVGIGTTSPSKKLHVVTTGSVDVAKFETDGNAAILIERTASIQPGASKLNVANNGQLSIASDNLIKFLTSGHSGGTERMRINNDGNVGIGTGTANPSQKLHVVGNTTITGVTYTDYVQTYGGTSIDFRHQDASTIMRIDTSNARVGIGTTSPTSPLTVKSNSTSASDSGITIQANANTNPLIKLAEKAGDKARLHMYNAGVEKIAFYTDGTNNHISAGNVGIGTSSPTHLLHVAGSVNIEDDLTFGIGGFLGTSSVDFTMFSLGDLIYNADSNNNGNSNHIFKESGNELMRIDSDGNVGIGTTSPEAPMHISTAASNNQLVLQRTDTFTGKYKIYTNSDSLYFYDVAQNALRLRIDSNGDLISSNDIIIDNATGDPYLKLKTAAQEYVLRIDQSDSEKFQIRDITNSATRVTLDTSGNIGIGTVSPNVMLDIQPASGNSNSGIKIRRHNSSNQHIHIHESDGATHVIEANNNKDFKIKNYGTSSDFVIETGNSERFRIDGATGNVGIGRTSPADKLHVYSNDSSTIAGLTLEQDGTGDSVIQYLLTGIKRWVTGIDNSDGDKFKISHNTDLSTDNVATFTADNRVGIGTTSPSEKLDVSGNIALSGNIVDTNTNESIHIGVNDVWFEGKHTHSAFGVWARSGGNGQRKMGIDGGTSFMGLYTNSTEKVRIDTNGKVGIGTTSPGTFLHIDTASTDNIPLTVESGASTSYVHFLDTGTTANFKVRVGSNGDNLLLWAGGSERMRIAADGGLFVYDLLGSSSVSNPQIRYDVSTKELYYQSSSLRYKEEVENLDSQIDKLMNLRTVKFKIKGTNENAIGLIAEEVVEVIPELTFKNEVEGFDEPQIDGVSYGDLPTYLLKAIQEQQEMINELKTEIQTLKSQINS